VLAADGASLPDGCFVTPPAVREGLLAEGFQRAVLEFLLNNDALSEGGLQPDAWLASFRPLSAKDE